MGATFFTVEYAEAPPLEDRHGAPWPAPAQATLSFLGPHGIRVSGGAHQRKYLEECAVALARACRGRVTSNTGKQVADSRQAVELWSQEQLVAEWDQAFQALQSKRASPGRKL
jgi:hypothetical protein